MKFSLELDGEMFDVVVRKLPKLTVFLDGESYTPRVRTTKSGFQVQIGRKRFSIVRKGNVLKVNEEPRKVSVRNIDFATEISISPEEYEESRERPSSVSEEKRGEIHPPMPGRIISISTKEGATLRAGSPLLILEAMKMQNEISSPLDGIVREIRVKPGDLVDVSDVMIVIEQT
ncbi:MAG: biotin/lipoyl-containing protein [Thermoplasmata archaeon]